MSTNKQQLLYEMVERKVLFFGDLKIKKFKEFEQASEHQLFWTHYHSLLLDETVLKTLNDFADYQSFVQYVQGQDIEIEPDKTIHDMKYHGFPMTVIKRYFADKVAL